MAYFYTLNTNAKFILLLCFVCFCCNVFNIVDSFDSGDVRNYMLGLLGCTAVIIITAMTLTASSNITDKQVAAYLTKYKEAVCIDGISLERGDIYINHGKLYIETSGITNNEED